tara:strand:- start:6394 stop:8532 length:2139 start_codon:yes stop_codon:yes gene_type:complete
MFSILNSQEKVLDSLINLDEVSVTGSRASEDMPITFSNISKKDLSKRNLGQDLPILLNFLPSVVTTSDAGAGIGYTGIRVRGSDATRVNVTINGIPYNDPESQGTFWVNLPDISSSVENIQVQRGVGTSTNGSSAFGATINILTDGISKEGYTKISRSYGSFNSQKSTVKYSTGLINNKFEFSGRHSKIKSDGYIDRASSNLKSYFFQGLYKNDKTLFKLLVFGGSEITYQSWYGVDPFTLKNDRTYNFAGEIYNSNNELLGFYDNQVDNYKQDHYQFHWNEKINANLNLSIGLNYTYGRGFYEEYNNNQTLKSLKLEDINIGGEKIIETDNVGQKWLDNDNYITTLSLQYFTDKTKIIFGGSYGRYIGDHFGKMVWAKFSSNALPNHEFYYNQGKKNDGNIYIKLTQKINRKLSLFGDFQLRKVSYKVNGEVNGPSKISVNDKFSFLNPKFGINYNLNGLTRMYFSYASASREPNRTDYENGNPKPEKMDDYELGIKFFNNRIDSKLNLYLMDYKDQLVLTGQLDEVGAPIRQNVGDSYRFGLEFEGIFKINDKLISDFNLSVSSNKNRNFYFKRDGLIQNLGKTNISFSPSVIAGNKFILVVDENFSASVLSKYVGEQYMGNIDSNLSKLDSYFTNDLNINYQILPKKWIKKMDIYLLVNNFLNQKYISNGYWYSYDDNWTEDGKINTIEGVGYYPQAGINFFLGTNIEF